METSPHPLTKQMNALDNQVEENNPNDALPKLSNNFFYIVSGSAGSGKTTVLLNLMRISHKKGGLGKYYKKIYLISPTHKLDAKLEELVDELGPDQCYSDLSDETVDNIVKDIEGDPDFKKEHYLIIMDDCMGQLPHAVGKSKAHTLLISRRHLHATIICLVQSYIRIPNLWRRNSSIISFFGSPNRGEVNSLIEDVNGDEDLMRKLIDDATNEPHGFLTIKLGSGRPIFYKRFDRYLT
jgi:hypothetical protein